MWESWDTVLPPGPPSSLVLSPTSVQKAALRLLGKLAQHPNKKGLSGGGPRRPEHTLGPRARTPNKIPVPSGLAAGDSAAAARSESEELLLASGRLSPGPAYWPSAGGSGAQHADPCPQQAWRVVRGGPPPPLRTAAPGLLGSYVSETPAPAPAPAAVLGNRSARRCRGSRRPLPSASPAVAAATWEGAGPSSGLHLLFPLPGRLSPGLPPHTHTDAPLTLFFFRGTLAGLNRL